jgi:hypothetical protein
MQADIRAVASLVLRAAVMKLILTMLPLISVGVAAADCPKPADWVRVFYAQNYSCYAERSDTTAQFTTPEFGALLKRDRGYSNGEIGALGL